MMDDYEYDERACLKCGHFRTHWRRCSEIMCYDGSIDESDETFMVEGSILVKCDTCHGTGHEHWCPKCGADQWEEERKAQGAYYTPQRVLDVIDPACGSGAFLNPKEMMP